MKLNFVLMFLGVIIYLPPILIFFLRYRSVITAKLALWGFYLLTILLFLVIGNILDYLSSSFFSENSSQFLMDNVLLLFEMICLVIVYQKQYININKLSLLVFGSIFLLVWLIEFWHSFARLPNNSIAMDRLRITPLVLRMAVLPGVFIYFFHLYKNNTTNYRQIPFFWIALGWIIYYPLTIGLFFGEVKDANSTQKSILLLIGTLAGFASLICYSIGFWKTKK